MTNKVLWGTGLFFTNIFWNRIPTDCFVLLPL